MKNGATRGRSEGDNDKVPSTSRFHFSKWNYSNIVLAWHSILIQKAKANLPSICAQAHKALGVTDVEIGNDKQRVNPEVRTCVGLDKSNEENIANNGDHEHLEKPKWYFLHYFTLFYKKNGKNAIWNK